MERTEVAHYGPNGMSTKYLTLIQQNDTHAQLEIHSELFWKNGQPVYRRCGGFARIATVCKRIRSEAKGECLFIDCGDAIHGTAVAQWSEGAALVPPLNALGIDFLTPGNWEFGFGAEVLRKRVSEMSFPVLACNVELADTGQLQFIPTAIREVGGVRVGLIGITSPIVTERMPKPFGLGLRFSDPLDTLPSYISELRTKEHAEIVVLISHLGLAQDMELVHKVEGIDVILSGHTHDRLSEPVVIGKTVLMQSGFSGSFLGQLDLEVSNRQVTHYHHKLVEVTEATAADGEVESIINQLVNPHRERLREVVGHTSTPLHRMTVLESPMDNLLTDAYRDLTQTDVAFSHGWRYGVPIVPGSITEEDLWQMVPTNPELFTAEMTGEQIRQTIEQSLNSVYAGEALRQKGGYPIRFSGLSAVVRLNNPKGARVAQLDIAGNPYSPDRLYTITAAGEQDIKHAGNKRSVGTNAVGALRLYLQKHSPVAPQLTYAKLVTI